MKYRIWSTHCGDPSEIHKHIEAKNDVAAKEELKRVEMSEGSGYPIYTQYWIERVDVEEKTTRI